MNQVATLFNWDLNPTERAFVFPAPSICSSPPPLVSAGTLVTTRVAIALVPVERNAVLGARLRGHARFRQRRLVVAGWGGGRKEVDVSFEVRALSGTLRDQHLQCRDPSSLEQSCKVAKNRSGGSLLWRCRRGICCRGRRLCQSRVVVFGANNETSPFSCCCCCCCCRRCQCWWLCTALLGSLVRGLVRELSFLIFAQGWLGHCFRGKQAVPEEHRELFGRGVHQGEHCAVALWETEEGAVGARHTDLAFGDIHGHDVRFARAQKTLV
mmetsp:Transcript_58470/g.117397  ORF Transcript_58470/g.117397 Transcript_58470/m.117397 type:complete len:268 (-) Transcript_58470:209-1012(-)